MADCCDLTSSSVHGMGLSVTYLWAIKLTTCVIPDLCRRARFSAVFTSKGVSERLAYLI
jgi:hypothetical protein